MNQQLGLRLYKGIICPIRHIRCADITVVHGFRRFSISNKQWFTRDYDFETFALKVLTNLLTIHSVRGTTAHRKTPRRTLHFTDARLFNT